MPTNTCVVSSVHQWLTNKEIYHQTLLQATSDMLNIKYYMLFKHTCFWELLQIEWILSSQFEVTLIHHMYVCAYISFIIQLVCRRTPLVTVTLICFQLMFSQGCFSIFGCVHWHDVYPVAVQPRVHGIEMYPVAVQPRMHFQLLSGTLLLFHQVYTVLA